VLDRPGAVHKSPHLREVCPVWTRWEGGSSDAESALLAQKTSDFSKFMVCPHGQGGLSQCGGSQIFAILCGRLLWTARPLRQTNITNYNIEAFSCNPSWHRQSFTNSELVGLLDAKRAVYKHPIVSTVAESKHSLLQQHKQKLYPQKSRIEIIVLAACNIQLIIWINSSDPTSKIQKKLTLLSFIP